MNQRNGACTQRIIVLVVFAWIVGSKPFYSSCWAQAADGNKLQIERPWFFTLYGGRRADKTIGEILTLETCFPDESYLLSAALAKEFYRSKRFRFEWEGQIVKHFEAMDHMEFNALITGRLPFFLRSPVWDMSLALGGGLSLASTTPELEANAEEVDDPSALLIYMLVEYTLALGSETPWEMVFRIHHRSGAAGLETILGEDADRQPTPKTSIQSVPEPANG